MGRGALLDYGMFSQNIMLLARARGLQTYPRAAWNHYAKVILPLVGAGSDERLVCGMALGYADAEAPVNTLQTPREPGWQLRPMGERGHRRRFPPATGIRRRSALKRSALKRARSVKNNSPCPAVDAH